VGIAPVKENEMEVLERFKHGDTDAFESLFRQFQGQVYGWIIRIVRDRGLAEDLTVETFWRIYRAHARLNPERNFGAWARRIATNVALDHLKTAWREVALPENLPARAQPNPAVHQEMHDQIDRAFRALPPRLRVAATLALVEEESYEEIADALGISVGAVKSRVFRAVRVLRRKLKGLRVGL
jgi:RNA polymerase sigma-70 factor (ECF subfamily)